MNLGAQCVKAVHIRALPTMLATLLGLSMQGSLLAQFNDKHAVLDGNRHFHVKEKSDRLILRSSGKLVAEFVFRDAKIRRPYFANVHAPSGVRVTRTHPPIAGVDAMDHDTMHPGLWLGLGDVSGVDFWRNEGTIEHLRFITKPTVSGQGVRFATESRLLSPDGMEICRLTSRFQLAAHPAGWLLIWEATFRSDERDFTFGDQEEMGFGARVATQLTEKAGGLIVNSHGRKTAANTWGQPALWCDYSGVAIERPAGITLMSDPANFRTSWWHNRDYGVFVANPFGRAAMKQGPNSQVTVRRGKPFRICFAAMAHDTTEYKPAKAYQDFLNQLKQRSTDD